MTIKEVEEKLNKYIQDECVYNHKENALKELDKVREKVKLDDILNIAYIIDDYPQYDHFLLKLMDNNFFIKIGFSREYLKSLNKKDIHKIAKGIVGMFGQFKLAKEDK